MSRAPSGGTKRTRSAAAVEELKGVFERLGIRVREERLQGAGGYKVRSGSCRLREERLILLEKTLDPAHQAEVLLDVLDELDLGEVELSDELKRLAGLA